MKISSANKLIPLYLSFCLPAAGREFIRKRYARKIERLREPVKTGCHWNEYEVDKNKIRKSSTDFVN